MLYRGLGRDNCLATTQKCFSSCSIKNRRPTGGCTEVYLFQPPGPHFQDLPPTRNVWSSFGSETELTCCDWQPRPWYWLKVPSLFQGWIPALSANSVGASSLPKLDRVFCSRNSAATKKGKLLSPQQKLETNLFSLSIPISKISFDMAVNYRMWDLISFKFHRH